MAEAIISLTSDKEKSKEMGRMGRKRMEDFFTIQQNVKRIQEVHQDILEKRDE